MRFALAAGIVVVVGVVVGGAAAALFVRGGLYDVSATSQHTRPVYRLLQEVMRYSVRRRARGIEAPPLDARLENRGAEVYAANCLQCHGAPGVAPAAFANGLQPLPGPLVDAGQRWRPRELYWITRNGIKMSGMPAWKYRLADDDLWALVAFISRLPRLSPAQYASLPSSAGRGLPASPPGRRAGPDDDPDAKGAAGDPARGREALYQHACNSCHVIPGVTGSDVHVGPPLAGIASRGLIAGAVANQPENMVRWLRDPRSIDRLTAMPDLGIAERDARDMAAYLATLRHE